MSALEVLNEARAIGVDFAVDGSDLVLAAAWQPPHHVIEALSCHKAEIIACRPQQGDGWSAEDWKAFYNQHTDIAGLDGRQSREQAEVFAYESCIIEWMNRNPEPSDPAMCAWCGRQDHSENVIVPFGTDGQHHTWLHPECWHKWRRHRLAKAQKALDALGIKSSRAV